jgi:cytochrome c
MPRRLLLIGSLLLAACEKGAAPATETFGLGRAATATEVAARDVDVGPSGAGLPAGHGSVAEGATIFAAKCASCHGARGEGMPPAYPPIVGRDPTGEGFPFDKDAKLARTIGNYWPYATTVFDYVRRAMPHNAPGSLTDSESYALTAWLLSANGVVPATTVLDSASLVAVKMPYVSKFVPDDRKGGREVR